VRRAAGTRHGRLAACPTEACGVRKEVRAPVPRFTSHAVRFGTPYISQWSRTPKTLTGPRSLLKAGSAKNW
jgi:hypothetical protein